MRTALRRRAGAFLVLVVLITNPLSSISPSAADAVSDKKAEAERIARQLEQQGRQVAILAEDYDEARVRIEAVEVELSSASADLSKTDRQAREIRRRLTDQAVEAYIRGGSTQALAMIAETERMEEMAVRTQYIRTLTSGALDVLDELRAVRLRLDEQQRRLDAARAEAREAAAVAETKRREATVAEAAQRRTLQQVEGELAVLVEAETKRRDEEEVRRAKAELAATQARAEAAAREAAARDAAARDAAARDAARRTTTTTTTTARPSASSGPVVTPRPAPTTTTKPRATTTTTVVTGGGSNAPPPAAGADAAIAEARRQIGKPYEWGGSGPDSFDCSGLTGWAWRAGGKKLSHSSRAQFSETSRVSFENIKPGDLLFYGDPIHHVALYIGDGQMIEAPQTGKNVRYASIYRQDYTGAGRVN